MTIQLFNWNAEKFEVPDVRRFLGGDVQVQVPTINRRYPGLP